MAGDLTFMRSRRSTLEHLTRDNLAVLGVPLENNVGRKSGTRFAPTALRETSVYFGWHANPQFSHPVDIDARVPIDTSEMHARLVDIGDLALEGAPMGTARQAVRLAMEKLHESGACAILLGGDDSIVYPAIAAAGAMTDAPPAFIQIGGRLPGVVPNETNSPRGHQRALELLLAERCIDASTTLVMAGCSTASIEAVREFEGAGGQLWTATQVAQAPAAMILRTARALHERAGSLHVNLDVSAMRASLHGMSEHPQFGGLTLPDLQKTLGNIGQVPVSSLSVTGLNPTMSGLSVVKTGLRLTVTALLAFIYARLGLKAAGPISP